jgi:hypothetical protein
MSSSSFGYFSLQMDSSIGGAVFLVLVIKIDQNVAMHSVSGQQDEHNEIRNQQCPIKRVGVVKPLKSLIQKMLAEHRPDALGGGPRSQRRKHDEIRTQQGCDENLYSTG